MSADLRYIDALLKTDALADAEMVTGQSYKNDPATLALGFAAHIHIGAEKERALRARVDSYFNQDLAGCLDVYADLGFVEVLCDEFTGRAWDGEPAPTETFRILWHSDGLLATVESYNGDDRNATKVYYNVRVDRSRDWYHCTSSGHLNGDVWVGDHDAREGIRHNLTRLRQVGTFLPTWIERPFLWLVTYSETHDDGYDYAAINAGRIARLPEHVRAAITPGGAA